MVVYQCRKCEKVMESIIEIKKHIEKCKFDTDHNHPINLLTCNIVEILKQKQMELENIIYEKMD